VTDPSATATARTEVVGYRADEEGSAIIRELLKGADNAMKVDCASQRVTFVVAGWFVFPKGSMNPVVEVEGAA